MPVTTTEIVAKTRVEADIVNTRWRTDADILDMVNSTLAELYDEIVMSREGYFQWSTELTLVSNSVNLPTDFKSHISLTSGTAPVLYEILPLESFKDRIGCEGPRFWIASRVLTVYPENIAPLLPVTLTYVPNAPVLLDAANIPVDMERFREYLEVGTAIKIQGQRGKDVGPLTLRMFGRDGKGGIHGRVIRSIVTRKAAPKIPSIPDSERFGYRMKRNRTGPYGIY